MDAPRPSRPRRTLLIGLPLAAAAALAAAGFLFLDQDMRANGVDVVSAGGKWGQAWTHADVGFYQVHMYGWVNDYFPYDKPLSEHGLTDKPVVMGEFPINMAEMDVRYDKFVSDLYNIGYAGALS